MARKCRWQGAALPAARPRPGVAHRHPYVPNVHLKASKLTAPDALACELAQRGLPACEIQELSGYEAWGRHLERNDFIIERPYASDPKAQKSASGQRFAFRVTFAEAVRGPLAFGFACHLGLGLFRREAPTGSGSD